MYRYIEKYNFAETWRDADEIEYKNEKYFKTLKSAIEYAKEKHKLCFERSNHDFSFNKKTNQYEYLCLGSWEPVLCIKKCEIERGE